MNRLDHKLDVRSFIVGSTTATVCCAVLLAVAGHFAEGRQVPQVEKIMTPAGECWRVVNDKDSFGGYTRWNCPEGVRL